MDAAGEKRDCLILLPVMPGLRSHGILGSRVRALVHIYVIRTRGRRRGRERKKDKGTHLAEYCSAFGVVFVTRSSALACAPFAPCCGSTERTPNIPVFFSLSLQEFLRLS